MRTYHQKHYIMYLNVSHVYKYNEGQSEREIKQKAHLFWFSASLSRYSPPRALRTSQTSKQVFRIKHASNKSIYTLI